MTPKQLNRVSRKLSLVLRHKPEAIGLTMDRQGYAEIDHLLDRLAAHGLRINRSELETIVAENDKKRFAFDETGTKLRASQGHSINVDLDMEEIVPPDKLYHGTATRFLNSIRKTGLERRSRQHVHLSDNLTTARQVGSRHGVPVILTVDAAAMHAAGHAFYRSANGVWLTDNVPTEYLTKA